MRKITAGLFISLDGVVEAPDQWHFPYFNEEMGVAVDATLGAADTVLFGRKTYDTFKTGVLNLVYGPAESTGDATYADAKVHLAQPEQ
jgi:dihydrofolate reductase